MVVLSRRHSPAAAAAAAPIPMAGLRPHAGLTQADFRGKHVLLFVTDQVGRSRSRGRQNPDLRTRASAGAAAPRSPLTHPLPAAPFLCALPLCRSATPSTSRRAGVSRAAAGAAAGWQGVPRRARLPPL